MANDLFGGLGNLGNLGGILGGIAKNIVPKDTPEGKLLSAQSDLADLQKQESDLLVEIGRQAYQQDPNAWPQADKLRLIQQNIASTQATLSAAQQAQQAAAAAQAVEDARGRCQNCGEKNPEGVRFCQGCGSPLATAGPKHCVSCGAELAAGTRFCGACGARQDS